ncbi:MAG: Stk1 family PASTA domain-containing Ser/Thr kinase [Lachnospiraceae bacterium]|nr:Stk1 family PASTA domain-containing Ser/Thr kinase [Lachnospiraceae bacterium]
MTETGRILSERYEIKEQIGSGGMADVYRAIDSRLNRLVAVKILKAEFSDDKNFISRFKNEAKSAAGLSHPNIVSVYDVGDDHGLHYIVMELVEGITLKKFIEKKGRLEVREAVGISIQIAQGMEAAHEHGIIHRDIKPQNNMISRDGKVKVADFGIAKVVSSDTYTQNAVGSVHYLSPEQARGGYYDERSDIYSLGVTLYEMLTGQLPFGGDSNVSVALKHIQTEARPAKELVPSIPFSLDRVIQKCMQKHPENRYSSASDLIIDLKHSITNPDGDFVRINTGVEGRTRTFTNAESVEIKAQAAAATMAAPAQPYADNYARPQKAADSKVLSREEFEELETVDSKFEKVVILITIFAAIALVIGAGLLFYKLFFDRSGPEPSSSKTTPTPVVTTEVTPTPAAQVYQMINLIGLSQEDAEATIKAIYPLCTFEYEEAEYSSQEAGTVIRTYPNEKSSFLEGSKIKLTLSAGGEPRAIPNFIGRTENAAKTELSNWFKVILRYEPSETISEGLVTRTEPGVGSIMHTGDEVILFISNGTPVTYTQVPEVRGKSEAVAREILSNAELELGEVRYQYSSTVDYGMIIYQSKLPGETIASGTAIDIVLSEGPSPFDQPKDDTPGADRSYFHASYDTTGQTNYCSELYTSSLFFELTQGEEHFVIYINYDVPEVEFQFYKVDKNTFPQVFEFRLFSEFANDFVDYGKLHEGEAEISAIITDDYNFHELETQTVYLTFVDPTAQPEENGDVQVEEPQEEEPQEEEPQQTEDDTNYVG